MHGELDEIYEFIKSVRPFDRLCDEQLKQVTRKLKIEYFKRQQVILDFDQPNQILYIVRTGAADVFNNDNELTIRVDEKGCFGFLSLLHKRNTTNQVKAYEDSLCYCLDAEIFRTLCDQSKYFKDYFMLAEAERLREVISTIDKSKAELTLNIASTVSSVITRKPVIAKTDQTISQAIHLMAKEDVSTLLLVDKQGSLVGVFTDKDLRRRVVAADQNMQESIKSVMSKDVMAINRTTTVFEAGLLMMRHNIHHLPVLDNDKPIGLFSTTDLLTLSNQSPVYTVAEVSKAKNIVELVRISQKIPGVFSYLVNSGLPADQIGQLLSLLGDTINTRILELAEEHLGAPPIEYCWLVAGSLGRQEQILHSDQDNVLLLSDDYDKYQHGNYFHSLSQFVSDGLNECGYVYCPGNVMATNEKWCQPLSVWKHYFNTWINEPEPKALMYCSIFF